MPSSAIKPMKLPNSLTAPSNRGDAAPLDHRRKTHRYLPSIVVLGWASLMCWPVIKDLRALLLIVFTPAGFIPWLERFDVPVNWRWPLSLCLLILLLSLPWFSILAGTLRATTICTVLCLLLAVGHIKGCQLQMKQAGSITSVESRGSVLECSSPLELFAGQWTLESAGGPAHSKTLPRLSTPSTHS
jgi:hypothetical protein